MQRRISAGIFLMTALLLAGCAPSAQEFEYQARKAHLERQNQGLRELIAEADSGKLIPADRFLVGVDESVLKQVLESQLPIDRPLGRKLVVHLDHAEVNLHNKYGDMTIEGNVHRIATPDRHVAVRIKGGLGTVSIDSLTSRLTITIAIDQVELLEAGLLDKVLGSGARKLISEKGKELLQDKLPVLQVPLALAQTIRIPAIAEGPIQLDSLEVPLQVKVERVIAAGGKLWLTLDASIGEVIGGEEGLGVTVHKKPKTGAPAKGDGK